MSSISLFAKLAAPYTTNSMLVFARFSICLLYVLIILLIQKYRGYTISLISKNKWLHVLRATSSVAGMFALFYAVKYISLVDANLLFSTNPLFIPILGAIFLATKTDGKNWLAIIVGFIGVVLVLRPDQGILNPVALIALSGGLFAAISILGIHELGKFDHPYTIMFYYFVLSTIITGFMVIFSWKTPDLRTLCYLFGVGIAGALCQECSVRALVHAPAKIVAPLMYSSIIFSGLFDWIFWKHIPSLLSIFGIFIICIGGSLTIIFASDKKALAKQH
jgi:drug/metabolite transporter (DMT)-like permease